MPVGDDQVIVEPDTPRAGHRWPWARGRRPRASARLRILGWLVLLLLLAEAASLLIQRRVLLDQLDGDVNRALEQEVEEVRQLSTGNDPATGTPFEGDAAAIFSTFLSRNVPGPSEVLLTFVDGEPFQSIPRPTPSLGSELIDRWGALTETERGQTDSDAGRARFVAVPLADSTGVRGVFVVIHLLEDDLAEIDRTTRVGAAVVGSVLLLAVGLAWLVAGRVLAPVRQITDAAKGMTEDNLGRRIDVPAVDDELAELARTFNAMLDRLDGAFTRQREFLDDAGHELRTPLTIVRGHLEVEGDDPADRAATRALVLDELDRMGRMVDDLLGLARSEQPDFLRVEAVDLDLLTDELHVKAEVLTGRPWRRAATGAGVVVADRQRLTQAVVNLVDNAGRHTGPDDELTLGSSYDHRELRLWVADTGPGVPAGERDRIFGRFQRADDGGRRAGRAGLGLAIVRTIAEAHGGRVEVADTPGGGATFVIVIPQEG